MLGARENLGQGRSGNSFVRNNFKRSLGVFTPEEEVREDQRLMVALKMRVVWMCE